MNQDQLTGILRIVVPAVCSWLAAQGYSMFGDAGIIVQLTTLVIGIASVSWSFASHSNASKLKAAAMVDPKIKVLVPDDVIAADSSVKKLVDDTTVPNVTKAAA